MFDIKPETLLKAAAAEKKIKPVFEKIDELTGYNSQKVLKAFINHRVSEAMFTPSSGYGYGDRGRDALEEVLADIFGAEDALIRHQLTCGTHTLGIALFGILRPGDTMLCVSGRPYDTICPVMGVDGKNGMGSLADIGVKYEQTDLLGDGRLDFEKIETDIKKYSPRMVYIQRSRGYSLRPTISVDEIKRVCEIAHKNKNTVVMVDNCYGEFTEKLEPTQAGADIIAGSLIKNPGGGIARCGGYICGKKELVEQCSYRMTVPGLGREVGASLGMTRELFMGLYNAPSVTGEALKTAVFSAALFEDMGFAVTPRYDEERHDIVQALLLENSENLIAFCRGLQSGSPVDSFVTPEPWDMPGYPCKVIMAAGAFTNGSSIELSGDAPLREPFAVWHQGGLNFHTAKVGIMLAADAVSEVIK